MPTYLVTWKIDIEADNAEEAAAQALICQRDPESTATVFEVAEQRECGRLLPPVTVDIDYPWDPRTCGFFTSAKFE